MASIIKYQFIVRGDGVSEQSEQTTSVFSTNPQSVPAFEYLLPLGLGAVYYGREIPVYNFFTPPGEEQHRTSWNFSDIARHFWAEPSVQEGVDGMLESTPGQIEQSAIFFTTTQAMAGTATQAKVVFDP